MEGWEAAAFPGLKANFFGPLKVKPCLRVENILHFLGYFILWLLIQIVSFTKPNVCLLFYDGYLSAPSCIILVAMASGKNILATKILEKVANWKSPIGDQQIKRETWKIINNGTNLINSTSGSITCLSLSPSCRSQTRHECLKLEVAKWSVENMLFSTLVLCVLWSTSCTCEGLVFCSG